MASDAPFSPARVRLALYQPDIAANLGAAIRLAACFAAPLDVIEPCGFPLTERALKRAAMDYADRAVIVRHRSWSDFQAIRPAGRLVLLTTRGDAALPDFRFAAGDALLLGRESAGVPDAVHQAADARVRAPIAPGARSFNVVIAGALALYEAARQLNAGGR
ncbi:MAG: tRNA (cytidine(34)-2'-O)-methyltransferase [Hyphomonadaceae bacterium]